MKRTHITCVGIVLAFVVFVNDVAADDKLNPPVALAPKLSTGKLGGVEIPSKEQLLEMHRSQYILHARRGKLTRIPVQKSWIPPDPGDMGHQEIMGRVAMAPNGNVYVIGRAKVCKSTDGGRTWVSYRHDGNRGRLGGKWGPYPVQVPLFIQILSDGTFVGIGIPHVKGDPYWRKPAYVWTSSNEGRNWTKIAEIKRPTQFDGREYQWWYATYAPYRLQDDTLLWAVHLTKTDYDYWKPSEYYKTDPPWKRALVLYRSTDGGKTWKGPSRFADWSSEGGMTRTASGKLLAAVRYKRQILPDDPPGLADRIEGTSKYFKHIFLSESTDGGRTWKKFRQLTTVFGQCYGFPAALPDGRVVLVHTTPYGPGPRGSRAMISNDEGTTWEDETYYLTFSEPSGYNQSVVLKDGTILTIACRHDYIAPWGKKTETAVAIRWKPVKR